MAATAIPVDTDAPYWENAVGDDFTIGDHAVVTRVVASKGLSYATISGTYGLIPDTDIKVWGGSLDVPIVGGGIVTPTVAIRGAYAAVSGVEDIDLSTYGAELFISKGFGPVTPYLAGGIAWTDAEGRVLMPTETRVLQDDSSASRFTLGLKISFFIPKLVFEATKGEETSYAAKISFGL